MRRVFTWTCDMCRHVITQVDGITIRTRPYEIHDRVLGELDGMLSTPEGRDAAGQALARIDKEVQEQLKTIDAPENGLHKTLLDDLAAEMLSCVIKDAYDDVACECILESDENRAVAILPEFNGIVGQVKAKQKAASNVAAAEQRVNNDEALGEFNVVIVGASGTCKTTLARAMMKALDTKGVITGSIEVGCEELMRDAKTSVGKLNDAFQTAQTQKAGLVIDEAYLLFQCSRDHTKFKGAFLANLNKYEGVPLILTGYEKDMRDCLLSSGNQGFGPRFCESRWIRMDEEQYSAAQLLTICKQKLDTDPLHKYLLADGDDKVLAEAMRLVHSRQQEDGQKKNGRAVDGFLARVHSVRSLSRLPRTSYEPDDFKLALHKLKDEARSTSAASAAGASQPGGSGGPSSSSTEGEGQAGPCVDGLQLCACAVDGKQKECWLPGHHCRAMDIVNTTGCKMSEAKTALKRKFGEESVKKEKKLPKANTDRKAYVVVGGICPPPPPPAEQAA